MGRCRLNIPTRTLQCPATGPLQDLITTAKACNKRCSKVWLTGSEGGTPVDTVVSQLQRDTPWINRLKVSLCTESENLAAQDKNYGISVECLSWKADSEGSGWISECLYTIFGIVGVIALILLLRYLSRKVVNHVQNVFTRRHSRLQQQMIVQQAIPVGWRRGSNNVRFGGPVGGAQGPVQGPAAKPQLLTPAHFST